MQDVLARTDGKVRLWPATLYGSLKRLIKEGLIVESGERPAPEFDDARRRYYRLTPLGRRVLDLESRRLEELVQVLRAKRRTESGYLLVAYGIKDGQAVAERPASIIADGRRRPLLDLNGRPIAGVPPGALAFATGPMP